MNWIASSPSDLVLALYRAARELPAPEFQDSAFALIKPWFQFASGVWGSGEITADNGLKIRSAHLCDVDPASLTEWQQINTQDKVIGEALRRSGEAITWHAPTLFAEPADTAMRDYAERWGRQSYMTVAVRRANPSLVEWISLYRPDADHHYTENERALFQSLFGHLSEALAINRALHFKAAHPDAEHEAPFVAMADEMGYLHQAEPGFVALLREEWAEADDRRLPVPMLRAIIDERVPTYVGRSIRCDVHHAAGMAFLRLRSRHAFDGLTPRRHLIARHFAEGHNHKDIARRAGISPATVRNHLRTIYQELGVRTKSELIGLLRGRRGATGEL